MANNSKIEWTEATWNPVTGCTKVSQGCKHCYAEVMANRLKAMGAQGYKQGFKLSIHQNRLDQPRLRKKSTVYFVNSMSDLFHDGISDSFIDKVFVTINETPQHTYQILTKRAERLDDYFKNRIIPKNVWLGVSVENRKQGVPRIDHLRKINASIRFLSVEPLLEDIGIIDLSNIHWVIVGGESGPKARPMKSEWVDSIQKQCKDANVAFFFKQWGGWGADGKKRSKKENGRKFKGRTWDEMPAHSLQHISV